MRQKLRMASLFCVRALVPALRFASLARVHTLRFGGSSAPLRFGGSSAPLRFGGSSAPLRFASLALLVALSACAPKLGDDCERQAQCSVNLDRTCDLSQPGGYCTIPDCEGDSCPEDGRCVRFQPDEPRLARAWCMAGCSSNGDCRDRYVCRSADQLNAQVAEEDDDADAGPAADMSTEGGRLVEVLDRKKGRKFCVVDKD